MKSVNLNGLNSTQPARLQPDPARCNDAEASSPAHGTSDQISVSSRAEEVSHLIARAGELADVRQGRVESVQQAIESGQHNISSSTIADAIIRDEGA